MKTVTTEDLTKKDREYKYEPELTRRLDDYTGDYSQEIINEIVLWKVARHPDIDRDTLAMLNRIKKSDCKFDEPSTKELLGRLLRCRGVKLPMASTFLRFRNPDLFQIIDQRVYRVIYGKKLDLPGAYNRNNRDQLVSIYLEYLRDLRTKCAELGIRFCEADRILYNADKRLNKGSPLKNYA